MIRIFCLFFLVGIFFSQFSFGETSNQLVRLWTGLKKWWLLAILLLENRAWKFLSPGVVVGCPVPVPEACAAFWLLLFLSHRQVVSTSRTPGHTKHFQTIFLTPNVRLCDCPGLVFPSIVSKQLQVKRQTDKYYVATLEIQVVHRLQKVSGKSG